MNNVLPRPSSEVLVKPSAAPRTLGLIEETKPPGEIPRNQRIFANRSLRLDQIQMVGFDMDYTLALYEQAKMEDLSIRATLQKLIATKGYPDAIRGLNYDPSLAIRGLVIDMQLGNVFKPDRYGSPGRAMHGRRILGPEEVAQLYQRERMRLGDPRYAWIDTLFALPEAVMYVNLVEFFDAYAGPRPDYGQLWRDIRECIDMAHRDGSIKHLVAADIGTYINRDPELAEALHRFRSSGKRLFLLTNSEWTYTDPVMKYLLDGALPAYPSWRNYFDLVVVSAGKPAFFTEDRPFVELDARGEPLSAKHEGPFVRGHVYAGGNVRTFEERVRVRGTEVLYIGDHIYGDMLRPRKSSAWLTAMVLQEMESEVKVHDRVTPDLQRLDDIERQLRHLDAEISDKQMVLRALQRRDGSDGAGSAGITPPPIVTANANTTANPPPEAAVDAAALTKISKKTAKDALTQLRAQLRTTMEEHSQLEITLDRAYNPYWGPLFREGHEISKFGEQVEAYACVYTSCVSNFRFYSPSRHFRGPRDRMPHER